MKGAVSTDLELLFKGLVAARLRIEFVSYKLVSNLQEFISVWGEDWEYVVRSFFGITYFWFLILRIKNSICLSSILIFIYLFAVAFIS